MSSAIVKISVVLVFCAVIAIMFFGNQWGPWLSGDAWDMQAFYFPAWVGAPYVLGLVAINALRFTRAASMIVLVAALLCCAIGSAYLYTQTVLKPDAMSGMLFLVVPIFQTVVMAVAIIAGKVVSIAQYEKGA